MNAQTTKSLVFISAVLAVFALSYYFSSDRSYAGIVVDTAAKDTRYEAYTFFATSTNAIAATSTVATSTNITAWTDSDGRIDRGYFVVAGAKNVNVIFQRTGSGAANSSNAGSSKFFIQVAATSSDVWYDYNALQKNAATTTTPFALANEILTGTSTVVVSMRDLGFYAIRCIVWGVTDGTNYCSATANY